jgi:hypothetical protein
LIEVIYLFEAEFRLNERYWNSEVRISENIYVLIETTS